jgi:hypothetical protein
MRRFRYACREHNAISGQGKYQPVISIGERVWRTQVGGRVTLDRQQAAAGVVVDAMAADHERAPVAPVEVGQET